MCTNDQRNCRLKIKVFKDVMPRLLLSNYILEACVASVTYMSET
jgi:hypothetical protein